MEDIRYSEFIFLQNIATSQFKHFNHADPTQLRAVGIGSTTMYLEMAIAAVEDLHIRFRNDTVRDLAARLRGELPPESPARTKMIDWQWNNPRYGLEMFLMSNTCHEVEITYRGLQRLEDLRDLLRRDRILDRFGVLLDLRYFHQDLEDALQRERNVAVSVIRADMDNFKRINDQFGHNAGDVVMKRYLECVRDGLGLLGTGFRDQGDEVIALIVGQGHERAVKIAEDIRARVALMECEHERTKLPNVTASVGVATTPPASRTPEIETLADERQGKAKQDGKNRVVSE